MTEYAQTLATGVTPEEFLALSLPDGKAELVRGEVRVSPPAGGPHGAAAMNLILPLASYVRQRGLGRVFGDGVGYELYRLPRTVRVPDASFVRADRLPPDGIREGLLPLAPDLAIEVLSPSERAGELDEKIRDYLVSGTPLLWVVDPARRTVRVVDAIAPDRWLDETDTLDGGSVIPGCSCPVAELFEGIARDQRERPPGGEGGSAG